MDRQKVYIDRFKVLRGILFFFTMLLFTWFYDQSLFVGVSNLFSIILIFGIIMIPWNYNKLAENSFFNYIGISFFFIGILKLLSFLHIEKQINTSIDEIALVDMLNISALYMECFTFLTAPFLVHYKLKFNNIFVGFLILFITVLLSIFNLDDLNKYILFESLIHNLLTKGLYLSSALYLFSIGTLIFNKYKIDEQIATLFTIALLLKFMNGLFLVFIPSLQVVGLLFEIASLYLIYRAFLESGLLKSFDTLAVTLKKHEESLKYERDFADNLIDSASVIVLVLDIHCKIIRFNSYMESITGFKLHQIKGKNFFTVFLPENGQKIYKDKFFNANNHKKSTTIPIITDTGEVRDIEWFNRFLYDSNGKEAGLLAVGHDITERKKAEEHLRSSEERYRTIINTTSEGFWLLTPELVTIDVNDSLCTMLGYNREELLNRNPSEFIAKESLDNYNEQVKQIPLTTQRVYELVFKKKNNETLHAIINATTILDSSGKPSNVFTFITDITKHKMLEKEIRDSEERFRSLSEATFEGIAIVEGDKIVEANIIFAQMFGYNYEKVFGMELSDFFSIKSCNKGTVSAFYCFLDNNQESQGLRKDKTTFDIEINSREIVYKGMPARVYVLRNITKYKEVQEQIKKSLKEKDILLREIHHRVKNNLQLIISLLNLQASYISNPKTAEAFNESKNRIKTMAIVHENLYKSEDLNSINAKDYIYTLANSISRSYRLKGKNIKLNLNIEEIYLSVDTAIPCGLIVNELLSNAMKYAFPNRKDGEVSISFNDRNKENYELIVSDNGIGLPFDTGFNNTKAFGLQLVHDLVESQLEGNINIDTSAGTRFVINLKEIRYEDRI